MLGIITYNSSKGFVFYKTTSGNITTAIQTITVLWNGNCASWYGASAQNQLNTSNSNYSYVAICYGSNQEIELITFTVRNTTYYAEPGMTWSEWINSSYNIDSFTISGVNVSGPGGIVCDNAFTAQIVATDTIIANETYMYWE